QPSISKRWGEPPRRGGQAVRLSGEGVPVSRMLEWRHPRAERLLVDFRRLPWLRIAEIGLLALIAVQAVRLLFAVATPLGPLGSWTLDRLAPASAPLPKSFDPFFRLQSPGAAAVSGLDLRLFGVREDQASGQ